MAKLTAGQESILRKQAAIFRGGLEECNKLLVEGGCEPEPETVMHSAKALASGAIARTTGMFSAAVDGAKNFIKDTKTAGVERQTKKEIENQIEDQMKAVKEQLFKKAA
jgi:hypothetical protein